MAESLLELGDIAVRHGDKVALQIPGLRIVRGEVLGLLGPNGAGKTTLLRVMGLLQTPDAGATKFEGIPVRPANALSIRRRIAMVFQEPLLLNSTAYENAALGLKLRGLRSGEIANRLGPWLDRLGIASLAARSARTLSGGEAQRTSLARALVLEPDLLLLDEPFAALDPGSRQALLRDFQRIVKEASITTVFVTHDRAEAFALADRVGIMVDGRMLQLGAREDVFLRPACQTVAEIVGVENCLPARVEATDGAFSIITIGTATIRVPARFSRGTNVTVFVRAEEVSLVSAGCRVPDRSLIHGKVINVSLGVSRRRVTLDCGDFSLVAELERACGLTFALGSEVAASFHGAAVHVIPSEKN